VLGGGSGSRPADGETDDDAEARREVTVLDRHSCLGMYHLVFVTDEGSQPSSRGTYLEGESLTRTVETWPFEG